MLDKINLVASWFFSANITTNFNAKMSNYAAYSCMLYIMKKLHNEATKPQKHWWKEKKSIVVEKLRFAKTQLGVNQEKGTAPLNLLHWLDHWLYKWLKKKRTFERNGKGIKVLFGWILKNVSSQKKSVEISEDANLVQDCLVFLLH